MKWKPANIAAWAAIVASIANIGTWMWQKPWWVEDKPDHKQEQEKLDLQRKQLELEHELFEERLQHQLEEERNRHPQEPVNAVGVGKTNPNHELMVEKVPPAGSLGAGNVPAVDAEPRSATAPQAAPVLFNISSMWDSVLRVAFSVLLGAGAATFFFLEFAKEKKRKMCERPSEPPIEPFSGDKPNPDP